MRIRILLLLFIVASNVQESLADEATIAVATNFLGAARALQQEFEVQTGHRIVLVSGSTGQLYAQVINGAPYDVYLAADQERPELLAESGLGIPETTISYARGRLVLWSGQLSEVSDIALSELGELSFRFLALADPDVAPYGAAARQVLERTGNEAVLGTRTVNGQNVAQAFAMTETGNAELGLIALSQAVVYGGEGYYQLIPELLHEPIIQDGIVLQRAAGNQAAVMFVEYLGSASARELIRQFGYEAGQANLDQ